MPGAAPAVPSSAENLQHADGDVAVLGPPPARDRAAAPWHHTGAIEAEETHDELKGHAGCLTAMTAARIA